MLRSLAWLQFPGRVAPSFTRGLEIPEGQWEGGDPTGLLAQPPGVVVVMVGGGGLCVGLQEGVMSHLEQTRHETHVANGAVTAESLSLS